MNTKSVLGALVVAGIAVTVTTAVPASADLVTRCVGTGGAVTVPGDLVVPAGASCSLDGTTVQGRVRVQSGADLIVVDGSLEDAVLVAGDGYLDATQTSIAGPVTSRGGYGVYLDRSQLTGDYQGRAGTASKPFAYLVDSDLGGQVNVSAGELFLDTARVTGPVRGIGTTFTDVINSTLSSTLTVGDNVDGAVICATEVDGNASYTGNAGVQVGAGDVLSPCDDVNYFGADLTISDNTGGVTVTGNVIRGDLSGTGNDPAPTGSDNRVRGTATGQFADLSPTSPARSARTRPTALRPPTSGAGNAALARVKQRRTAALVDAAAAGSAKLARR